MGMGKSGTHATRRETPGKSLLFVLPKLQGDIFKESFLISGLLIQSKQCEVHTLGLFQWNFSLQSDEYIQVRGGIKKLDLNHDMSETQIQDLYMQNNPHMFSVYVNLNISTHILSASNNH